MDNNIFEQMMSRYPLDTSNDRRNATYEVMQQVVLSGLYRGGFFEHAAFYGGTCLRIFQGLQRYSEDMDFSLLTKDESFTLERYFPAIIDECRLLGRDVEIERVVQILQQYGRAHMLGYAMLQVALQGTSQKSLEIVRLSVSNKLLGRLRRKYRGYIAE